MDAKRRTAIIRFMAACLAVALLLSLASGAWALPDSNSLRRTVPTRTPTREQPATDEPAQPTPTKKSKKDNPAPTATLVATVTPGGPTVTPGEPTETIAVTPVGSVTVTGDVTPTGDITPTGDVTPAEAAIPAATTVTHYSETGGDYTPLFAVGGIIFVLLASGAVVMWLRHPGANADQ